jgi:hypothetical protein
MRKIDVKVKYNKYLRMEGVVFTISNCVHLDVVANQTIFCPLRFSNIPRFLS